KIEAGKMHLENRRIGLQEIKGYMEQAFRQQAKEKKLEFLINISPDAPANVTSDIHRLQKILKNLISNAIKFTDHGYVHFDISPVRGPVTFHSDSLRRARQVLSLSVSDSGIGIPQE